MHPVNYLFEDIKRNHWGITAGDNRRTDRGGTAKRKALFGLERRVR